MSLINCTRINCTRIAYKRERRQAGLHACRAAAASANTPSVENSDKLKLQLRQAQQMAAAVARKKEDMMMKLKRLTDKQVCICLLVAC